jgi:hypothetical protein
MPQRFLRPGIRNSERWNSVPFDCQSLYIRLLTLVDDYGRHDGRPAVIHGECFAVWNEQNPKQAIDLAHFRRMLQQLAATPANLIRLYEADGKQVLQILQWEERIREGTKEKWPKAPPIENPQQLAATCSNLLPPSPPPSPSSPPSPVVASLPARFKKPSVEELKLHCAKIGLPESEADKFFNFYESKGWKVGKAPMSSWPSAMANWKIRYQENGGQLRLEASTPEQVKAMKDKWVEDARR